MKKISAIFLIAIALISLAFFVFLFLAVRFDPDEMIISLDLREHSLWYVLETRYLYSSFRFTSYLLDGIIISNPDPQVHLIMLRLFYATVLVALINVVRLLTLKIFGLRNTSVSDRITLLSFAVCIVFGFYFLCSGRIEIFGWPGATQVHLVPLVAALYAVLVISKPGASFLNNLSLVILAFVIAGGAEHTSMIVLVISTAVLFLGKKDVLRLEKNQRKKISVFAGLLLIFYLSAITNPGKAQHIASVNASWDNVAISEDWRAILQAYKLIGLLLLVAAIFAFKSYFNVKNFEINYRACLTLGVIGIGLSIAFPLYVFGKQVPQRMWLPFDVIVFVCVAILVLRFTPHAIIMNSLFVLSLGVIIWYSSRHISALISFRHDHDAMATTVQNGTNGEVIHFEKNPAPDLVNYVDLKDDPENQLNHLFCRYYNSPAKISVGDAYSKSR